MGLLRHWSYVVPPYVWYGLTQCPQARRSADTAHSHSGVLSQQMNWSVRYEAGGAMADGIQPEAYERA
jgi:hypothetical protein